MVEPGQRAFFILYLNLLVNRFLISKLIVIGFSFRIFFKPALDDPFFLLDNFTYRPKTATGYDPCKILGIRLFI